MEIGEKADKLFAAYTGNVPGASIAITRGGKILLKRSYGYAKLPETRSSSVTNYRLASLSKAFTAMSILKLIDAGKLGLEDRLSDFISAPSYAKGITVRNMLGHTSGIINYDDDVPSSYPGQVHENYFVKKLQGLDSPYFKPGSKFQYSNVAYVLLTVIVERVSDVPFPRFVEREIFHPLGMLGTKYYEGEDSRLGERAYGYTGSSDEFRLNDQSKTSATYGDGCVYSSTEDLMKWDAALRSGGLVSEELLESAFIPCKLNDGRNTEYGFGWFITVKDDVKILHHAGETSGFLHKFIRVPEEKMALIILTNRDSYDLTLAKKPTEVEDTLGLLEYFDLL
jgi:CubicO group peptidase (beta-lactamase class C family)